jgi:hypothetical protein
MNWGKSIVVAFLLFALFIGVLVTVCLREDVSLVSPDYYTDELAFQSQIDRLNNTQQLAEKPAVSLSENFVEVNYKYLPLLERGELTLFRPSDMRFDKKFVFQVTSDSVQRFDIGTLPLGMYKARILWTMNGKEYYMENIINL